MKEVMEWLRAKIEAWQTWQMRLGVLAHISLDSLIHDRVHAGFDIFELEPLYLKKAAYLRMHQALHNEGSIVFGGDSRIHYAEPHIRATNPRFLVLAIGGLTAERELIMLPQIQLAANAQTYIDNIGAGDLLRGDRVEEIAARILDLYDHMAYSGVKRLFWINTPPPGNPDRAASGHLDTALKHRTRLEYVRDSSRLLEDRLIKSALYKTEMLRIIDVRSEMIGSDGWQLERYCAPDRIHHNVNAYTHVYLPRILGALHEVF